MAQAATLIIAPLKAIPLEGLRLATVYGCGLALIAVGLSLHL